MKLVIVESPTKAKTISRYITGDVVVLSSFGHVRDLPKSDLGIDVEHDFTPKYVVPTKAKKNLSLLKKEAAKADTIVLATDEDREGESIAWHLLEALGLSGTKKKKTEEGKDIQRIVFHEITKEAILHALEHPRTIDQSLVDAQQARRILDRLVGYKLSPLLWKRYYRGLSAGRVQSVALRIIVDREREIQAFKPQEYWTVDATLLPEAGTSFTAHLTGVDGKPLGDMDIASQTHADIITKDLEGAKWQVQDVQRTEVTRSPMAPFTTSTMQQTASRRLRFSSKQTMMLAQRLYEAGYITYMRTDSVNLSEESLAKAATYITENLGAQYYQRRTFKTKSKGAQEAHEAVRPTDPFRTPEEMAKELDPRQAKLYDLIWRRFIASQMPQARIDSTGIDVRASREGSEHVYDFRATGSIMTFDGFTKIYPSSFEETPLPIVKASDALTLEALLPEQHFTKPPARFNEASLIKVLEKEGIGRPSTYASIISTIVDRGYVEKDKSRSFVPMDIGMLVTDFLVEHFPAIVDTHFTSHMEAKLDDIAEGKEEWVPVVKEFYEPFAQTLAAKMDIAKDAKAADVETTDKVCDKCGSPMVVKRGRFGKFIACSNFPTCKNVLKEKKDTPPPEPTGEKCDKCGEGDLVMRTGRFGKFIGCSRYPKCKNIRKLPKEERDAPVAKLDEQEK